MKTVGVRDLKNRLSEYLREVRSGAGVLVIDRGEVIAELSPPGQGKADTSLPAGVRALARRGLVLPGAPADPGLYKALPRSRRARRRSAELLDEERGPR
jgi:antitoxin (DNA-binding transcriptional repressor) of toxin-antitoxin stability system